MGWPVLEDARRSGVSHGAVINNQRPAIQHVAIGDIEREHPPFPSCRRHVRIRGHIHPGWIGIEVDRRRAVNPLNDAVVTARRWAEILRPENGSRRNNSVRVIGADRVDVIGIARREDHAERESSQVRRRHHHRIHIEGRCVEVRGIAAGVAVQRSGHIPEYSEVAPSHVGRSQQRFVRIPTASFAIAMEHQPVDPRDRFSRGSKLDLWLLGAGDQSQRQRAANFSHDSPPTATGKAAISLK